ncbi:MAG: VWA domain-containing protein, partial [Chloroflexota bacterium]
MKTDTSARWGLLLALGLCALLLRPATAQTNTYQGIDLLFLVDQSGSMGGVESGAAATDPLALRFEAVQYALTTLSEYRRVVPSDTTLRMAVVNFG